MYEQSWVVSRKKDGTIKTLRFIVVALLVSVISFGAVIADDEIARIVRRIELLSTKESPAARFDTLVRTADLLRPVDPTAAARFGERAKQLRTLEPLPLVEDRRAFERTLAAGDAEASERAAQHFLRSVEHSAESPEDYAWFATARRKYNLRAGSDNASVRAREALADLAEWVKSGYDFELPSLDGARVRLRAQPRKPVLITFWATWCAPCQEELPFFEKLWREHAIPVLAITDESANDVKDFVSQNGYTFPVLLDANRSVATHFSVDAMPTSILIDQTGRFRARVSKTNEAELRRLLRILEPGN